MNPKVRRVSSWRKYTIEFLSVFTGVTLAFALNLWNETRKESRSETKTLIEIRNGLKVDLTDLASNRDGHTLGLKACDYFYKYLECEEIVQDSAGYYYICLLRNFISIQNVSAYESLRSRGLELISNDSLRIEIVSLYDFYYEIIEKLEEDYSEMQYHQTYYRQVNDILVGNLVFNPEGELDSLKSAANITELDKNEIRSYLWKIKKNRSLMIGYYNIVEDKVSDLIEMIEQEVDNG